MIILEYDDIKPRGKSGISKLGTNTLQGLLIIIYIIDIMKLTHMVCFGGVCSKKRVEKVRFWGSDNKKSLA